MFGAGLYFAEASSKSAPGQMVPTWGSLGFRVWDLACRAWDEDVGFGVLVSIKFSMDCRKMRFYSLINRTPRVLAWLGETGL